MHKFTFYKKNGEIKVICEGKDEQGNYKKEEVSAEKIISIISEIKKEKDFDSIIDNISYSGEDLRFKLGKYDIVLKDKLDFVHNSDFRFIFEHVNNKKYKINKTGSIKTGAIIVVGTVVITVVSVAFVKANIEKPEVSNVIVTESSSDEVSKSIDDLLTESFTFETTMNQTKEDVTKSSEVKPVETTTTTTTTTKKETTTQETSTVKSSGLPRIIYTDDTITPSLAGGSSHIYIDDIDIGTKSESDIALKLKNKYGDIIKKYCNIYGVDYEIMCAVASRESSGNPYAEYQGAVGLFQIQEDVWASGSSLTAYNYTEKRSETIHPNRYDLTDVESNTKIACMIMSYQLGLMNNNYMCALQSYNMGEGSFGSILSSYSYATGKTKEEIKNDYSDIGWTKYTNGYRGDPKYVSHVMEYYGGLRFKNSEKRKTK